MTKSTLDKAIAKAQDEYSKLWQKIKLIEAKIHHLWEKKYKL